MNAERDVEKSARARAEGNASFKKGKWTESIGHYTKASLLDRTDPAPLCNRAQCFLNLQKWEDADRDCSSALSLQGDHVKALFRRGVARKELGKHAEALKDFEKAVKLDPKNTAAKEELDECRARAAKAISRTAPAETTPVSQRPSATITELPDDVETGAEPAQTASPAASAVETTAPSFAAARQTRDAKRSFVAARFTPSPQAEAGLQGTRTNATSQQDTSQQTDVQSAASSLPTPSARLPPSPPRNPSSLAPGAGIALVRKMEECQSDEERWSMLSRYEPSNLPKLLPSLLEPEVLASLLSALQYASKDHSQKVQTFLTHIPTIPGFRTSSSMLLKSERAAGQSAWTQSGGTGSWPQ